jgi:hypothetical protein
MTLPINHRSVTNRRVRRLIQGCGGDWEFLAPRH